MEKSAKNLRKIMVIIGLLFLALVLRLAYIQLAGHEELAQVVRAQSMIALEGSNTRGMIYDRNGALLVADKKKYVYIIKEDDMDGLGKNMLTQLRATVVKGDNEGYSVYSSEHYDKAIGKKLIENNNAYILQASGRYSEDQLAEHFIGYVNKEDNSGAAGLELMYDDQLSALNRKVYAVADVAGNILPGRGLVIASDDEMDSSIKEGIRTSIDKNLQEAVEDIISQETNNCAAVVMDVKSGGILAMACTPEFDPNNVSEYMENGGDELLNKATQGEYPPGSVFKIVVAAAALEQGVSPQQKFKCNGSVKLGDVVTKCQTGGDEGHGKIDFETAFVESCNSYFIQLGQKIGTDSIIEKAEDFGFGKKILGDYPQESTGHLMTEEERYGTAVANLAIGQGETLATPLQISYMTNIIASGGINTGAHILMDEEREDEQIISENTAEIIGNMMEKVTEHGTASILEMVNEDGTPKAAVKTGTAEYGAVEEGGSHGWITGYTPCSEPEYTITVFVEDGDAGSLSAGPIFKKIIEYLEESGSYSKPTLA